jgi:hypothetical protein
VPLRVVVESCMLCCVVCCRSARGRTESVCVCVFVCVCVCLCVCVCVCVCMFVCVCNTNRKHFAMGNLLKPHRIVGFVAKVACVQDWLKVGALEYEHHSACVCVVELVDKHTNQDSVWSQLE